MYVFYASAPGPDLWYEFAYDEHVTFKKHWAVVYKATTSQYLQNLGYELKAVVDTAEEAIMVTQGKHYKRTPVKLSFVKVI